MKMDRLSEPTNALAKTILTEVGFEDRLIGYRLRERSGPMPMTLYSFEEVVILLSDSGPRIEFNRLERWLRETMADDELADRIKLLIDRDRSDYEKSVCIRNLMLERLIQCKKIV